MGRWGRRYRRWTVSTVLVLAVVAAAPAAAVMAAASTAGSHPEIGVVHTVTSSAQQTARALWTPSRMAAATPAPVPFTAGPAISPPPGTPSATLFNGVPTVRALFFTTNRGVTHFCTASVVDSTNQNLVLTAAHCVDPGTFVSNIEFVPGFHAGHRPYGAWVVKKIFVARGWANGQNPNLDFAFMTVTPPGRRPLQKVTGGLQLGIDRPYRRPIEVIGYNNTDHRPVECATHSFQFRPDQMEVFCHGYPDGTSGGPWIVSYNPPYC